MQKENAGGGQRWKESRETSSEKLQKELEMFTMEHSIKHDLNHEQQNNLNYLFKKEDS